METYDVLKKEQKWGFMKEGAETVLKSFDKKDEAAKFGREYLQAHGGHMRIWSADAGTLQREHSYQRETVDPVSPGLDAEEAAGLELGQLYAPTKRVFSGITQGATDAAEAAGRLVPEVGKYLSKGAYGASYYTAYGVVFAAVTISRSIPMPAPLARGLNEGTEAAMEAYEKGHHEQPRETATT